MKPASPARAAREPAAMPSPASLLAASLGVDELRRTGLDYNAAALAPNDLIDLAVKIMLSAAGQHPDGLDPTTGQTARMKAAATLSGVLIAESLKVGGSLDRVPLQVKRIWREDYGVEAASQPRTWTLIQFEAAVDEAETLADSLCDALTHGAWYCDFRSDEETFVVFSGRWFRYARDDEHQRRVVEDYAKSVGVPEEQLDWPA